MPLLPDGDASSVTTCRVLLNRRVFQIDPSTSPFDKRRERRQNVRLNEPLVTVLLPVAVVPVCGISTNENVPVTLFAVSAVIVTLPLPPTTLATQSDVPTV